MGRSWLALLVLLAAAPRADAASFRVAPAPSWVDRLPLPADRAAATAAVRERRVLLTDRQLNLTHGVERYVRWATRIDDEAGLQSASHVSITFDPSYQRVVIHSVVVVRDGQRLDRLQPAKIKQAQREPNLESQMYDGRQTLVLFLDDLRVGDIIDVEYTTVGADPTLAGHLSELLVLGGPFPVERLRARLLVPKTTALRYREAGPEADQLHAQVRATPFGTEYVWERTAVPASPIDQNMPHWFQPLPVIELSDFDSWYEVGRWARTLMRPPALPARALVETAEKLRAQNPTNLAFVRAATRFVQDEVRYVAVETGISRRMPTPPDEVLKRRFGDCKDKSLLLTSLLRLGGIDSEPALVSTAWHDHLDAMLPGANVFDHAIVHVRAGPVGRQDLWLDPTISLQGGDLARTVGAPYGRALVLDGHVGGLTVVPREPMTQQEASIHDRFEIPEAESHDPARLEFEREFRGAMADNVRASLRGESRANLTKEYLQIYARRFPSIAADGEAEVADDRESNVVRITGRFSIRDPWKRNEVRKRSEMEIAPTLIGAYLEKPDTVGRTTPLAMAYPVSIYYAIDLEMPKEWPLTPERRSATGPAFDLVFTSSGEGRTIKYEYSFASTADHVEVADLARHAAALDDAQRILARTLSWRPLQQGGANLWAWGAVLLTVLACVVAAPRIYRYRLRPTDEASGPPPPALGGLLALIGLRLWLSPVALLITVRNCIWVFRRAVWLQFFDPSFASYHPSLAIGTLLELVCEIAVTAYFCVVIAISRCTSRSQRSPASFFPASINSHCPS
ncbi:MAG: Transglutaminase-like enzyme [bacterium]|nr:Transglutaminase-like enzyme [bacterium]